MRRAILTAVFGISVFAAHEMRADSGCPPPSVPLGAQCVLRSDVTLTNTMWIASGTKLNCQGHRITPVTSGTIDNPRTAANEFSPAQPELAMLVRGSYGVKIQNCVISGFDFGIIVAQSKAANAPAGMPQTSNKILGNTIDVRTNAIDVIKSDDVIINGNRLTFASERGRGVVIDFDSDHNQVTSNTIISTDAASTGQVRQLPGGPFIPNSATAIMDNEIHCLQSDKNMQNFIVGGVLIQVPSNEPLPSDIEDSGRSSNNLIADNDILDLGNGTSCTLDPDRSCRADADCVGKGTCLLKQNSGVAFNIRASDTVVRGNRLSGRMERGVSFGGTAAVFTSVGGYPGVCTQDALRLCSIESDCNIAGYDPASVGPCIGATTATYNGNSQRLTAEDNSFSGVYETAALFGNNTDHFTFRGNTVASGASGIRILATAINGLIERNVVSGAGNALYLAFQPAFTQVIRLNDFTNYAAGVRTSNDFRTATDIAVDKGNYWGRPCPGFGADIVFFDNGLTNPNVTDGHPYGQPVARTVDGSLPPPCM